MQSRGFELQLVALCPSLYGAMLLAVQAEQGAMRLASLQKSKACSLASGSHGKTNT